MARQSNADRLKLLTTRVREARKFREREGYDDLWDRMTNMYRGKHYESASKEDRMLVNLAFATKNVIAPSVAINSPKFVVNARKPEQQPHALITEQVLNYLWRRNKYQEEFRLAVDDFLVFGHGWVKVGYRVVKDKEEIHIPDAVDQVGEESHGISERTDVPENVESENTFHDEDFDRPFVERISPKDVFCDPDARNPREMKWIAQRVRRPLADVKVDERYDQTARKEISGTDQYRRIDDEDRVIDGEPRDPHITYVDVWEYYDIRRGEVSTFVLESEKFLRKPVKMPYSFGHPFVMLRNYEVSDRFYPMGELEAIEGLQKELNATRTQMMNHRKRYNRKSLIDKEAFEQQGLDALQSDQDNTIVPVDLAAAVSGTLNGVIIPMPQEGVPPDFYNQSAQITEDIDRVSGVSDYMRGAQSEIRRTATEAAMIQDAQNARAQEKLVRIEMVLSEIGTRVVKLMQQYMTGEMAVRVVGSSASQTWINFDSDYIQGEFDFEVEGGSTQPRNHSFRTQQALNLVDALAPFIQLGVVNPAALARHILSMGFDIKDPEMFLADPAAMGAGGMPPEGQGQPPEGQPPEQAGIEEQLPPDVGVDNGEAAMEESPIAGIDPGLVNQLMSQVGMSPRG